MTDESPLTPVQQAAHHIVQAEKLNAEHRYVEALAELQEVVTIRRKLATEDATQLPELAVSLNNMANVCMNMGDFGKSVETGLEASLLWRELAEKDAAHQPGLARCLNNLSNAYGEAGELDKAMETGNDAVDAWRALSAENEEHMAGLAGCLTNFAGKCLSLERVDEGIAPARESVDVYRKLAAANPSYMDGLAAGLNNLSAFLGQAEDGEGALLASKEAVALYQTLAESEPEAYVPDVARAMANLAFAQQDMEKLEDAADSAGQGVAALAPLFLEYGMPLASLMDALLGLYVEMCDKAGINPNEKLLKPIEALLEELDEGEDEEHDHEHVH